MLYGVWLASTQSSAWMMLLMVPPPCASSTLSETSEASGALPAFWPCSESAPLPAMIPATCEPWPRSS